MTAVPPEIVLLTGAAGRVGGMLRPRLVRPGRTLRLLDVVEVPDPGPGEEVRVGSVTDHDAVSDACARVSAVVHLGGIPGEAAWDDILATNIHGTAIVFEAARRQGVPRVVLASSNHAVGFHPSTDAVGDDLLPRPDTFYGVSKVTSEALGSLYHDRHGLDVVCLRIGTCEERPPDVRALSTWLSPDDCGRLVTAALDAPSPGFRIVWGVSANSRRRWSLTAAHELGYRPHNDGPNGSSQRRVGVGGDDLLVGPPRDGDGDVGVRCRSRERRKTPSPITSTAGSHGGRSSPGRTSGATRLGPRQLATVPDRIRAPVRDHSIDTPREGVGFPDGARTARIIRETYDQLYDGQRTGRFSWSQLHKTEKTHMGTLIEINLHRQFGFDDGDATDYRIAGIEVDCKFSMGRGKWMIPAEALGHICLVVWANDETSSWSAGLVRITRNRLGGGDHGNRDGKRTLNELGRRAVVLLWGTPGHLDENLLLQLPAETRQAILGAGSARASGSGQARINELFWHVQCRIIDRNTVATVARQSDYMKRVRYDGGARSRLRGRGVIILGHQRQHQQIASDLMMPIPRLGQFVSVQVVPLHEQAGAAAKIGASWWTPALPDDEVVSAPRLGESDSS